MTRTEAANERSHAPAVARVYLSIVGHQIMATFNPLVSLYLQYQNKPGLTRIVLLATPGKSEENAQKIEDLFTREIASQVEVRPISYTLKKTAAESRLPAHQAIMQEIDAYPQAEIYFNLAGGMNFQSAACAYVLHAEDRIRYLSPEFFSVQLYSLQNNPCGKRGSLRLDRALPIPTINVTDLLRLQAVACRQLSLPSAPKELIEILRQFQISVPQGAKFNIKIAHTQFDIVFNHANTLYFCKYFKKPDNGKIPRQMVREFIAATTNRADFGDLLHHRILVLTNDSLAAERFRTESFKKIEVGRTRDRYQGEQRAKLRALLNSFFTPQSCEQKIDEQPLPISSGKGDVLYVFLGKNILTTMKAIWSHRAETTKLFYTKGDARIEYLKERLNSRKIKGKIPSQLEFIPVSFFARELEDYSPEGENFVVNATPGTKIQTFFLTRLARRYGKEIYTINKDVLSSIDGKEATVCTPDIDTYIDIAVESPEITTTLNEGALDHAPRMQMLHKLFQVMQKQRGKANLIRHFWQQGTSQYDSVTLIQQGQQSAFFVEENAECFKYGTNPNDWFEQYVGFMAIAGGAEEIRLSLKSRWCQPVAGAESFRSECDVCAKRGSRYFMISCKSGQAYANTSYQPAAAREIEAVAKELDRMVIPLLAVLAYNGQPKLIQGVYMFGHRTLTDPQAMNKLFADAASARSTTRPTS